MEFRKKRLKYLYQIQKALKIPFQDLLKIPIPVIQDLISVWKEEQIRSQGTK